MMDSPIPMPGRDARDTNAAIVEAIGLIDELVELLGEENTVLGRGFPASLVGSTARKNELGAAFERWVRDVRAQRVDLSTADATLRAEMTSRSQVLHTAVDENLKRLRAAMEASHRRLEAVMRAVREDVVERASYGSNGRARTAAKAPPVLRSPLSV